MANWIKKIRDFFLSDEPQTEQQELVEKPQKEKTSPKKKTPQQQKKRKTYTFDDLAFSYDNYSVLAGRGVSITSYLRFDNGYSMYVSVANFANEDFLHSKKDFLEHDYLSAYKITIEDPKHCRNNTCLNEDGESILAYSKKDVTRVMKQIQQLDENGQLPKVDTKIKVEARKNNIKKARDLRKELEKRNKEERISGVVIADNIAKKIISGEEKRQITPDVVAEYKKQALHNK